MTADKPRTATRSPMPLVWLRFYAELNSHLPPGRRHLEFPLTIQEGSTLRKILAAVGVPAAEIELILVNGTSVGLDHVAGEGDRVSVYPVFDSIDVGPLTEIEHRPARRLRFVLDVHLGKLAHHLRMLGFDTVYRNDATAAGLLETAAREDRILLSKSRRLVGDPDVVAGYRVRSSDPREQLMEVLRRFDLVASIQPFTRCLHCNSLIVPAAHDETVLHVPAKSRATYRAFTKCPSCKRIYWEGSHVERMKVFTGEVLSALREQ